MTAYAPEPTGEPGSSADGGGAPADGPAQAPAGARTHWPAFDAVVLAGGAARRLGGADKPGVSVGGRSLLDRVLAACAGARTTVVVGGRRPTARPVQWALEEPRGGGPLAALHAGVRRATADRVVVLSADLPFLGERTVHRLLAALPGSGEDTAPGGTPDAVAQNPTSPDGAVLVDDQGREQPLVGAYLTEPLQREIALLAAEHGGLTGLPLRLLTAELSLTRMPDPVASFDCDTWDDIATARSRIREHEHVLDEWMTAVKDELGLDLDVDTGVLLDLTRDVAHGVARPAAPLTSFLVGYAAALNGGGREAVAEAARKAAVLAARWEDEDRSGKDADRPEKPDAG